MGQWGSESEYNIYIILKIKNIFCRWLHIGVDFINMMKYERTLFTEIINHLCTDKL